MLGECEMQSVSYTDARNNLKMVLDEACETGEHILVSRKAGLDCVILSIDEYNSLMETAHLLSTPANVKHLLESIRQMKGVKHGH